MYVKLLKQLDKHNNSPTWDLIPTGIFCANLSDKKQIKKFNKSIVCQSNLFNDVPKHDKQVYTYLEC